MTVAQTVWGHIQSNDHRLMRKIHRWRAPRWFRILMIMMTRLGDGWLWYSIGLILLVFGGSQKFLAIGAATAAAAAGIFLVPDAETCQPAQAALRNRAALLVVDPAPGQIFVPFGTLDYVICHRAFHRDVLSRSARLCCWRWRC